MDEHALIFRVLRLQPPSLFIAENFHFVFKEDVDPSLQHDFLEDENAFPFNYRIDASSVSQTGVTGTLVQQSSFGNVYIGEAIRCAISLQNASATPVNNVGIRVSLSSFVKIFYRNRLVLPCW